MPDPVVSEPAPPAATRAPRSWPDCVLCALVVAFAFLAASFTARNSDVWLHLASGRLIAEGGYSFGSEPFNSDESAYWANHAWLSDLAFFKMYTAVNRTLVIFKAFVVALTALVMLRLARGQGPKWIAVGSMLLALVVIAPRTLVQSACLSPLLLGLCLLLFVRGGRAHFALPVVIAAWANLDDWYVLGPVCVGLACVGQWLTRSPDGPRPAWWLLPACVAACLVTPFHVFGLTLPMELRPGVWASPFVDDPRFNALFQRPWHWRTLWSEGGYSLAAWAFFVLLALGLVSFAVNRSAAIGWRGIVWVGFAGLACWQVRLAPFFAVVAGPIAALNFREVAAKDWSVGPGRLLVAVAVLPLIGLTWPGWLDGFWARDHGLAWETESEPGLDFTAGVLKYRRAAGSPPAGAQMLVTHPAVGDLLVWLSPGERVNIDSRLGQYTKNAAAFEEVSRAFNLGPPGPGSPDSESTWADVGVIVVYDPDPRRMAAAVRDLAAAGDRWSVVDVLGAPIVRPAAAGPPFSPDLAAFGPQAAVRSPSLDGAAVAAAAPASWARRGRPSRVSGEGDAAAVYVRLFEGVTGGQERSPALPILGARAARKAVAEGPEDEQAWLSLARATLYQSRATWEAVVGRGFPLLVHVRQAQIAAALVQAAIANPESPGAHEALAGLYTERGFIDLAVRHRREQLRLTRSLGPPAGESDSAFADRLSRLTSGLEEAENALQDAQNRFLVHSYDLAGDPRGRARLAASLGLAQKAIDVLETSSPDEYREEGLRLLLELLTWTGQTADVRALLDRDEIRRNPNVLELYEIPGGEKDGRAWGYRLHAHDWFDLCQAAASGRYTAAAGAAQRLRTRLKATEYERRPYERGAMVRALAFGTGIGTGPDPGWRLLDTARECGRLKESTAELDFLAAARADLHAIEGLLRLESGFTDSAAEQFQQAADVYGREAQSAPARPGEALTKRYLDALTTARPPGRKP